MSNNVSHIKFVAAWESSANRAEAAQKVNTTLEAASTRAAYLRKRGVKLKKFNKRPINQRIDVAELNQFIRKMNGAA